jgi:hypothetical protein
MPIGVGKDPQCQDALDVTALDVWREDMLSRIVHDPFKSVQLKEPGSASA